MVILVIHASNPKDKIFLTQQEVKRDSFDHEAVEGQLQPIYQETKVINDLCSYRNALIF